MKKLMKMFAVLSIIAVLSACGEAVTVNPAQVGKVLTRDGFQPEILPPSKFRLPFCLSYCDKLIVLDIADRPLLEKFAGIFMPKDKLKLTVEVRGTYSIPNDTKRINMIFDRIQAQNDHITAEQVYNTYGRQAIRGIVRSTLAGYDITTILENRDAIALEIHEAINKKLQETNTPLVLSRFELAKATPPDVIVEAQEAAKRREIAVQQEEADARVAMVKAEKDLEVAKKRRLVQREEALAIAEQNEIAAKSVTPQLLKYRQLEVFEKVLPKISAGGNLIVVPIDMSALNTADDAAVFGKILGRNIK